MVSYLIELRFKGAANKELKRIIHRAYRFLGYRPKKQPVPHVSVVVIQNCRSEKRLIQDFAQICSKHKDFMKYRVCGVGTFFRTGVVFLKVYPNKGLKKLRRKLIRRTRSYTARPSHEKVWSWKAHMTIALKLSFWRFIKLWWHMRKRSTPSYKHRVLSLTLLKKGKILREYDFVRNQLLTRRQALGKRRR